MDVFMSRLELEKENFKKSISRQVDDLFVSVLSQFPSTLITPKKKPVGRPRKLKKAISFGSSGKLLKAPNLSSTPVSSPSPNGQTKGASKVSPNDCMSSPVNLKKSKSNASRHEQVQHKGEDDADDEEHNQAKNEMENNSNYDEETPMDEGDEDKMAKVKLQQSPEQQQSQSKSKLSVKSSTKSSLQKTRFSPRITALKQSRLSSSPSFPSPPSPPSLSSVSLMNGHGFRPIYRRRSLASRIVPPLQPEMPKETSVSVLKSSKSLNSSKQHICRWCHKIFFKKPGLDVHELIHQRIRPYSCKWKGCQFKAIQRSHLVRHIRSLHFSLPRTKKEQVRQGIVDDRDPRIFMKVHKDLLEKSRLPRKTSQNADDRPKRKQVKFSL